MISRHFARLALALSVTLAACGGGGSDSEPVQTQPTVVPTDLLVIGNSITRHPPHPAIGWTGDWGMAASSRDKDFAHLTGAAWGLPVTAVNVVQLENDPTAPIPAMPVTSTTVVVVHLGDNAVPAKYGELLAAVNKGAKLYCVSTYWGKVERDAAMRPQCQAAGGTWVYIGDIYPDRQDDTSPWPFGPIMLHPYDWSMQKIADRIIAVK